MNEIKRLPTHPGDVLKEELESRGISQKYYSELIGVSYTMLNEILNGKRPVTINMFMKKIICANCMKKVSAKIKSLDFSRR